MEDPKPDLEINLGSLCTSTTTQVTTSTSFSFLLHNQAPHTSISDGLLAKKKSAVKSVSHDLNLNLLVDSTDVDFSGLRWS
eukprot:c22612_g4_i1 orf=3-245(+)